MNGYVDVTPLVLGDFTVLPPPVFDCCCKPSTSSRVQEPEYNIRDFILTGEEQLMYDFPQPGPHYKPTKIVYAGINNRSPLFVLDCEMCRTEANVLEVTRVSILTDKGDVVLDTLVQPANRIVDYVTKYSGITAEMMKSVSTTLQDVHNVIDAVLPMDAILVGHSLNCDLMALKLAHPHCIDTSLEFNSSGDNMRRSKLRDLCETYLGRQIQKGQAGHCSIEDCAATMDLAKLKLSADYVFGNVARGFDLDTLQKPQPKKRLLIGQAPARYRPKQCVRCTAAIRVDCSSRDNCTCWWRNDVYAICVRCMSNDCWQLQQQQQ